MDGQDQASPSKAISPIQDRKRETNVTIRHSALESVEDQDGEHQGTCYQCSFDAQLSPPWYTVSPSGKCSMCGACEKAFSSSHRGNRPNQKGAHGGPPTGSESETKSDFSDSGKVPGENISHFSRFGEIGPTCSPPPCQQWQKTSAHRDKHPSRRSVDESVTCSG